LPAGRCLICDNPPLRSFVDDALNRGFTNVGISASVDKMGGKLDQDVVGRHKNRHWVKPVDPDKPQHTPRDLAIIMRDKVVEAVEDLDANALLFMGKELAPMVGKGLQAQAILDKRDATNKKLGIAAGALSLQAWLAGLRDAPTPPELDDGNTFEGTAVEVE
jgi:hypothetical protein